MSFGDNSKSVTDNNLKLARSGLIKRHSFTAKEMETIRLIANCRKYPIMNEFMFKYSIPLTNVNLFIFERETIIGR